MGVKEQVSGEFRVILRAGSLALSGLSERIAPRVEVVRKLLALTRKKELSAKRTMQIRAASAMTYALFLKGFGLNGWAISNEIV